MKYKKIIASFVTIAICLTMIGFVYREYKKPTTRNLVFGVSYMTMNNPFYEVINNEMRKVIEQNGDVLITLDPALHVDKQKEQIQYFIDAKVDGIFINPVDADSIDEELLAASKAGIAIVAVDAPLLNEDVVDVTVVSDNYDAGVQCAKDMMSKMEHANIILLKHTAARSAKDRIDGFLATIEGHENYKVINERECEGQLERTMPMMDEMLKETPDVQVVMALNDPSALGAIAALESNQRSDVKVYGVDGTPDVKSLLMSNEMVLGTVAQSPITLGKAAAEQMYNCLQQKQEKLIVVPVTLITKDNIHNFDEKGWQ